jgi:hypothetical protein
MSKGYMMKRYVIAIYEGLAKIGQRVESDSKFVDYIADWYESQGYETQVFEYEV